MPSLVADRIRVDLGGADTIEEPQGKVAGNQRACSRVVGLQNSRCAIAAADRVETICDIADGLIPARRLETTRAFGSNPLQGARQAHARIAPDPVVTNRTFAAQRAPTDAVFRIAHHIDPAVCRQSSPAFHTHRSNPEGRWCGSWWHPLKVASSNSQGRRKLMRHVRISHLGDIQATPFNVRFIALFGHQRVVHSCRRINQGRH